MVEKVAVRSRKGTKTAENQDCPIVEEFEGAKHFFAVCDGHGAAGHEVSAHIRSHLPKILMK